jgi:hypothetical protein
MAINTLSTCSILSCYISSLCHKTFYHSVEHIVFVM